MTQRELTFTATVEPMFGNIDLESMSNGEILELITDTYDIPADCIDGFEVK